MKRIYLILIFILMIIGCTDKNSHYDKWKKYPDFRYKFVKKISADSGLYGLTKEEITVLLGQPDNDYIKDGIISYNCGFQNFSSVNLAVQFTDNKAVKIWAYKSYLKRTFSKEEWLADKYHRYEIVDDLLNNYKLIGLPKNEILEFLGEPDIKEKDYYEYNLGVSDFMAVDPNFLVFKFTFDIITNCWIIEH